MNGNDELNLIRQLEIQKRLNLGLIDDLHTAKTKIKVLAKDNTKLRNKIAALQGGYEYVNG